jgi:hypothetical protein
MTDTLDVTVDGDWLKACIQDWIAEVRQAERERIAAIVRRLGDTYEQHYDTECCDWHEGADQGYLWACNDILDALI